MTSSRPYLLRAIYEWLLDNNLTPYLMVDALVSGVEVPDRFIDDGRIVLNIEPQAVGALRLGNDAVEFDARFSGTAYHIFLPLNAIRAIYAYENGRGMVFSDEEDEEDAGGHEEVTDGAPAPAVDLPPVPPRKGRPNLKVVK